MPWLIDLIDDPIQNKNMQKLTTKEKAAAVNHDPAIYGSFAEIGAGQETARNFFQAGGASATIAKTISAYDMAFSDAIYGAEESKRYVCESRLNKMLKHEYDLLEERLLKVRPPNTTFFAFANTVAAKSMKGNKNWHGWLGVRFQTKPGKAFNDIIVHVRMLDQRNFLQQEALGILGVNLIYGAFYQRNQPEELVSALMDGLDDRRIEIDMVRFSGPDVEHIDNRLVGLSLVELGHTNSVMFLPGGQIAQPAEILYNREVLIQRGSYRPITHLNLDMLNCGLVRFSKEFKIPQSQISVLLEITMSNLKNGGSVDKNDFLARIDLCGSLGYTVLISNYREHFELISKLKQWTNKRVAATIGVGHLPEVFNESHYKQFEGGLLETLGRLFNGGQVKLYVYPARTLSVTQPAAPKGEGTIFTAENFEAPKHLDILYKFFVENHLIEDLQDFNPQHLSIDSREVLKQIKSGQPGWEKFMPNDVAKIIQERKLFR